MMLLGVHFAVTRRPIYNWEARSCNFHGVLHSWFPFFCMLCFGPCFDHAARFRDMSQDTLYKPLQMLIYTCQRCSYTLKQICSTCNNACTLKPIMEH